VAAPANATVSGYVRHAAVLPHAAAVVSHAGLSTVLASLAHGVPLVCVPLGREQPQNAAAVARVGAGVVVDPASSPDALRAAVAEVLASASMRDAARRLADEIASTRGRAADEVESLLSRG
jgi:UDP:flavonoid glycosyltransferase YjiC (YdhE family)